MTSNPDYHIDLFWSKADDCWIADVPDLEGCNAHGESAEVAAREIQVAMSLWLEVAAEYGDPIPVPRYNPSIFARLKAA